LTQIGSTPTPEHNRSSGLQKEDEGEITQKAQDLQERLCWMEKQRVRDLKQIQENRKKERKEYKKEKKELMAALVNAVSALNSKRGKGQEQRGEVDLYSP
jgi:hypothetical protein